MPDKRRPPSVLRITSRISFLVLTLLLAGNLAAAENTSAVATFDGHKSAVRAIAVSSDGKIVATAGEDGMCYLLDAGTLRTVGRLGPHRTALSGVAFGSGGVVITSGLLDEQAKAAIFFWNPASEKLLRPLTDSAMNASRLVVSNDGKRLAFRLDGNAVRLYPLETGGRIGLPPPGKDVCHNIAFSPDGKTLSICNGPTVHHLDFTGQQPRLAGRNLAVDDSEVISITWLPDGMHVATGHSNGIVRVRKMGDDEVVATLRGHSGSVTSLAVSDDAQRLVTGGSDHSVRVWDLKTAREVRSFTEHTSPVTDVALVTDDLVASASEDGSVRLWSISGDYQPRPLTDETPQDETPLAAAQRLRLGGRIDEAIAALEELVAASQSSDDEAKTMRLRRQLAEAYRADGKYEQSLKLYLQCFQASERSITAETKDAPDDLLQLARTHSARGDDASAFKGLKAMLERRTERLGERHPAVADVHFALGETHTIRREWPEAIVHWESCLKIRRVAFTPRSETLIRPLQLAGKCYFEAHQAHLAEEALAEAVELCLRHYGPDDARTAEAECRLGRLYGDTGRPKEGGDLVFGSYDVVARSDAPENDSSIYVRSRVAAALNVVGQHEKSLSVGREVLDIARRLNGPHDYRLRHIYSTLAFANVRLNRAGAAIAHYEHVMQLTLARFGEEAWQSGFAYASSGIARYAADDVAAAEKDYLRAVELFESCPAGPPTNAYATYHNLASVYRDQQDWDQCAKWYGQSARSSRANLYAHVPVLPDETKFVYATVVMSSMRRPFSDAVTFRQQPQMATASAEWIVNLKGFVAETLADRAALSRENADPETRKLLMQLTQVRQRLAAASISLYSKEARKIDYLRQRERELAAELGAQTRNSIDTAAYTSLDDVRATLDDDEVVVEFLRFHYDPLLRNVRANDRYVAWIIPPRGKGDVRLVDIGPAKEIEQLVEEYHRQMERSFTLLALARESVVERQLAGVTEQLSAWLIERLPGLTGYQRWRISPDGALWLVPWAALKTRSGKYAIEDHEVSYLITSRQLTWKGTNARRLNRAVIFANPDYNAGVRQGLSGAVFSELPGTVVEAKALLPSLKTLTQGDPVVVHGATATESRVKALTSPRVLILSTHGYFDALNSEEKKRPEARNPLLRCGLALASANGSMVAKTRDGNDGVLTGLEVTSLDLRGTELVVLSACQTALGDVHRGEGVSGLRQAFQLAGARSVVATLWSIPDAETVDVTGGMFNELAAGRSDADALARAQRSVIAQRRKEHGGAHPLYWAAFCVTRTGK